VIAELPGTTLRFAIRWVMPARTSDSWHNCGSATDNADGTTTMIERSHPEAAGARPRADDTHRDLGWGEQGLLGSKRAVASIWPGMRIGRSAKTCLLLQS